MARLISTEVHLSLAEVGEAIEEYLGEKLEIYPYGELDVVYPDTSLRDGSLQKAHTYVFRFKDDIAR